MGLSSKMASGLVRSMSNSIGNAAELQELTGAMTLMQAVI